MNPRRIVAATLPVVLCLSACSSSPTPVDVTGLVDMPLPEASEWLVDNKLEFTAVPDVDPASAAAALWVVQSVRPSKDALPDELVTLHLSSVLASASTICDAGRVEDAGFTLILDMEGEDVGSGEISYEDLVCVLDELDIPESIRASIGQTRSLDGRQDDSWRGLNAQWSYHPDNGLDVILTIDE